MYWPWRGSVFIIIASGSNTFAVRSSTDMVSCEAFFGGRIGAYDSQQ